MAVASTWRPVTAYGRLGGTSLIPPSVRAVPLAAALQCRGENTHLEMQSLQHHHPPPPGCAEKEAALAMVRFGGVLGLFAATRSAADAALGPLPSDARPSPPRLLPSLIAGAVAVALPTAFIPARQQFLRAYYASLLRREKAAVSLALVLASSALSGGVTMGGADYLLRRAGVSWS